MNISKFAHIPLLPISILSYPFIPILHHSPRHSTSHSTLYLLLKKTNEWNPLGVPWASTSAQEGLNVLSSTNSSPTLPTPTPRSSPLFQLAHSHSTSSLHHSNHTFNKDERMDPTGRSVSRYLCSSRTVNTKI